MVLQGQCAIITGATGSIGVAAARRLAEAGASVVLADLKGHEEAADKLAALGHVTLAVEVDVTNQDSVDRLAVAAMESFGRIDILVNNAALAAALKPSKFETVSPEEWHKVYDVNVVGVIRMCKAVSPHMRKAKSGRIINFTSGTAFKGTPGLLQYTATKGAINALTQSLAAEFASDGILVNAVSPGFTATDSMSSDMAKRYSAAALESQLIKRADTPADTASVVYFLASPDAGFVTGQIIVADGGAVFH